MLNKSVKKIIGYSMLVLFFSGIFGALWVELGLFAAIGSCAITAFMICFIAIAAKLIAQ